MTLRGRLATAFLAVVLGPVLLGAFFVGSTSAAVSHDRSVDRLDLAAATVRTSLSALCRQLHAAAGTVAIAADEARRAGVADNVVGRGLAGAILVTDATGAVVFQTPDAPPRPWLDCGEAAFSSAWPRGLGVQVEMRDPTGAVLGTVIAVQTLDDTFVVRLAAATGVEVTLLYGSTAPAAAHSTEPDQVRSAVVAAAARLRGDTVARTDDGRYVRRVGPSPGQPLPLVLSVPPDEPTGLYVVLVGAVVLAGILAVLAAWWLARSTTRPLVELAHAADRVAGGDLATRVPVRTHDEVGHLATTFNRMTRETQAYIQALTTSRDQLRGHVAVLGDILSSTHDRARILKVILRTALATTSARAGVVLLLDRATGVLVGQVAEGLDELLPSPAAWPTAPVDGDDLGQGALQVPFGSGVLGTVAATGEPQLGRVDRDRPALAPTEPRCHTYIAVPVSASGPVANAGIAPTPPAQSPNQASPGPPGRSSAGSAVPRPAAESAGWPANLPPVLGVLAVYDRIGTDEFDDRDLATLRTFATQAAVAVDNVRMHDEAQRLSLTDPLTGLWNYRYLKTLIRTEVERAGRFGRMLTVLALDLDRFKDVNDTYGHATGDAVLVEFARRIRAVVREVDLAFRQGGEEFVVLLPETDARGGVIVAERLGAAIRDTPMLVPPHAGPATTVAAVPVTVTVSIGIAVYPDHATTGQQVLDAADDALYAAKAAGRDTYRVAVAGRRPIVEEIPVPSGAATPDDGLPWAGRRGGGTLSAPPPPRQSRGR